MTGASPVPPPGPERFHDLDALRAVMLYLSIVLHGALFVLPEPELRWPLHEPAALGDGFYRVVVDASHGCRLQVFFLLGGFFGAMVWQRRGARELGRQRLKRIGIPFLVSCLTVIPASFWLLRIIATHEGVYAELFDRLTVWMLPFVWLSNMGHLWFLWYLLLLVFGFIGLIRLGVRFSSPVAGWLLIPASAVIALSMHVPPVFGLGVASAGIVPNPLTLLYYACFFFFGVYFHQHGIRIRRWWCVALVPAVLAFWLGSWLIDQYREEVAEQIRTAAESGVVFTVLMFEHPTTAMNTLAESAYAWLMCFGLMGLFRLVAWRQRWWVRYLSDSTYWVYLTHLPLIVVGQWLVLDLPIHYHFKFLIVCAGTTVVLLIAYHWFVRYTFIGRLLNGPRKPRRRAAR